jgi:hypothetical protein
MGNWTKEFPITLSTARGIAMIRPAMRDSETRIRVFFNPSRYTSILPVIIEKSMS